MIKNKHNKSTLVIDRRNWAQKVMYRYTELRDKAIQKRQKYINGGIRI